MIRIARIIYALAFSLCLTACGMSSEDLQELVRESKACVTGDTCEYVSGPCLCMTPVNSDKAAEVIEAAKSVTCDENPYCKSKINIRCEDNICTADDCSPGTQICDDPSDVSSQPSTIIRHRPPDQQLAPRTSPIKLHRRPQAVYSCVS